jgi:hypothetical protein
MATILAMTKIGMLAGSFFLEDTLQHLNTSIQKQHRNLPFG